MVLWCCENGYIFEVNMKGVCFVCGSEDVYIFEIKGLILVLCFLIFELVEREEYELRIFSYVCVDLFIFLMYCRLLNGEIEKNICEKVFLEDWFYFVFWLERIMCEFYEELKKKYKKRVVCLYFWEEVKWKVLKEMNIVGVRIVRVVVYFDYCFDGFG